MLEAWPRSRRSILIQGEELSVDDTCVVIIQSLENQVCEVSTESVTMISTSREVTSTATEPVVVTSVTVTIGTFVITVVAVLIVAILATIATVIAISVRTRKLSESITAT